MGEGRRAGGHQPHFTGAPQEPGGARGSFREGRGPPRLCRRLERSRHPTGPLWKSHQGNAASTRGRGCRSWGTGGARRRRPARGGPQETAASVQGQWLSMQPAVQWGGRSLCLEQRVTLKDVSHKPRQPSTRAKPSSRQVYMTTKTMSKVGHI